jgi:hypothetical protein
VVSYAVFASSLHLLATTEFSVLGLIKSVSFMNYATGSSFVDLYLIFRTFHVNRATTVLVK